MQSTRRQTVVDIAVLLGTTVFLLSHFSPSLLSLATIPGGGDTPPHYQALWSLRESLGAGRSLLGWSDGNLAGFPTFQLYFPLPFLLALVMATAAPLEVAFKLTTVLGVFALPWCVYFAFRRLAFSFPTPALAAVSTLPFLFMEANSMWGGNIPSTLAGEFSYSIGLALSFLFLGILHGGIEKGKGISASAILLAAVGFSHGYTLLFCLAISGLYVVVARSVAATGWYLLRVWGLAFALMGFWIVPLLAYSRFATTYRDQWVISSWREVIPTSLWPWAVVALAYLGLLLFRIIGRQPPAFPAFVLAAVLPVSFLLYRGAHGLGLVDIRFIPFLQLGIVLLAAVPLGQWAAGRPGKTLVPVIVGLATVLWVSAQVHYIPNWIDWNYSGLQSRQLWPVLEKVNRAVSGGPDDPRVAWEHSPLHEALGTTRAFELLPMLSGRSTLEGLYLQSSASSPFIYFMQSEISRLSSCPIPDYHCARLDPTRAAEHLRLFNAGQIIVRTADAKAAFSSSADYEHQQTIPPYEIFRVTGRDGDYVVPLQAEPILLQTDNWKRDAFHWFKRPGSSRVVLVMADEGTTAVARQNRFTQILQGLPDSIDPVPLPSDAVRVEATVSSGRIHIRTTRPGHPLLVKVTYHPRWQIEGGGKVYLASPSFMLVFPQEMEISLVFADPPVVWWGRLLTLLGVMLALAGFVTDSPYRPSRFGIRLSTLLFGPSRPHHQHQRRAGLVLVLLVAASLLAALVSTPRPAARLARGVQLVEQNRLEAAARRFEAIVQASPASHHALMARYYLGLLALRQQSFAEAEQRFLRFALDYPANSLVAEALYSLGVSRTELGKTEAARDAFDTLRQRFPDSQWANRAESELISP